MLKRLSNRKLKKMQEYVNTQLKYAEGMSTMYYEEIKQHPDNNVAKERFDIWTGRKEAFLLVKVRIDSLMYQ